MLSASSLNYEILFLRLPFSPNLLEEEEEQTVSPLGGVGNITV